MLKGRATAMTFPICVHSDVALRRYLQRISGANDLRGKYKEEIKKLLEDRRGLESDFKRSMEAHPPPPPLAPGQLVFLPNFLRAMYAGGGSTSIAIMPEWDVLVVMELMFKRIIAYNIRDGKPRAEIRRIELVDLLDCRYSDVTMTRMTRCPNSASLLVCCWVPSRWGPDFWIIEVWIPAFVTEALRNHAEIMLCGRCRNLL